MLEAGSKVSFYLRKSIKAGPLRVNLSKSGIGVSAGIPGFRVGTGPRGSYVRMGIGGVQYRSTLGNGRPKVRRPPEPGSSPSQPTNNFSPGDVVLSDVTGVASAKLVPAQPSQLVQQLNAAAKWVPIWPFVLLITVVVSASVSPWIFLVGVPLTVWVWWRDKIRRTVVVFYEIDGPDQMRYQRLVDSFNEVQQSQGAWHIVASGAVRTTYQYKVNAGASALVKRQNLTRSIKAAPHISSNIAIPTVRTSGRTVYFLPDRVLVRDGRAYADIEYSTLHVSGSERRFIEDGSVPSDSVVVGSTWKYVNKGGGPDRRFKDNRKMPILKYSQLEMQTGAGLRIIWQFLDVPQQPNWLVASMACGHDILAEDPTSVSRYRHGGHGRRHRSMLEGRRFFLWS